MTSGIKKGLMVFLESLYNIYTNICTGMKALSTLTETACKSHSRLVVLGQNWNSSLHRHSLNRRRPSARPQRKRKTCWCDRHEDAGLGVKLQPPAPCPAPPQKRQASRLTWINDLKSWRVGGASHRLKLVMKRQFRNETKENEAI